MFNIILKNKSNLIKHQMVEVKKNKKIFIKPTYSIYYITLYFQKDFNSIYHFQLSHTNCYYITLIKVLLFSVNITVTFSDAINKYSDMFFSLLYCSSISFYHKRSLLVFVFKHKSNIYCFEGVYKYNSQNQKKLF